MKELLSFEDREEGYESMLLGLKLLLVFCLMRKLLIIVCLFAFNYL